jgi:hypothetical protein
VDGAAQPVSGSGAAGTGADAVGISGSAMLGMRLNEDAGVREDVDFVIEGAGNVPSCASNLSAIRSRLGFSEVTRSRQY